MIKHARDGLCFNLGHSFYIFRVSSKGARRVLAAALTFLFSFKTFLNILEIIGKGEKIIKRRRGWYPKSKGWVTQYSLVFLTNVPSLKSISNKYYICMQADYKHKNENVPSTLHCAHVIVCFLFGFMFPYI